MFRIQNWSPNSLEKKCLEHLDSPENWLDILKVQQPAFDELQSWKPFWRIFIINITLFLIVFGFLFSSLEVGFGGFEGLLEDLSILLIVVAIMSTSFAAYVTYLYRRTWNRRAIQISSNPY
jgi:hypothetical protein